MNVQDHRRAQRDAEEAKFPYVEKVKAKAAVTDVEDPTLAVLAHLMRHEQERGRDPWPDMHWEVLRTTADGTVKLCRGLTGFLEGVEYPVDDPLYSAAVAPDQPNWSDPDQPYLGHGKRKGKVPATDPTLTKLQQLKAVDLHSDDWGSTSWAAQRILPDGTVKKCDHLSKFLNGVERPKGATK